MKQKLQLQLKKMSIDSENELDQTHFSVFSKSSFHHRFDATKVVYPDETHMNPLVDPVLSDPSSTTQPDSGSTHFMKLPYEVYKQFAFS